MYLFCISVRERYKKIYFCVLWAILCCVSAPLLSDTHGYDWLAPELNMVFIEHTSIFLFLHVFLAEAMHYHFSQVMHPRVSAQLLLLATVVSNVVITWLTLEHHLCISLTNENCSLVHFCFGCVIVEFSALTLDSLNNNFHKICLKFLPKNIVIFDFHECRIIYPEMEVIIEIFPLLPCIVLVDSMWLTQKLCLFIYFFSPFCVILYHPRQSFQNCIVIGALGSTSKDTSTVD